jgi:hypothetical protein
VISNYGIGSTSHVRTATGRGESRTCQGLRQSIGFAAPTRTWGAPVARVGRSSAADIVAPRIRPSKIARRRHPGRGRRRRRLAQSGHRAAGTNGMRVTTRRYSRRMSFWKRYVRPRARIALDSCRRSTYPFGDAEDARVMEGHGGERPMALQERDLR